MYLEYVTKMAVSGGLFYSYENLGIQIHHFLRDDLRCVFTFDRLQHSPKTDLIIPLLHQRYTSDKDMQIKALQLLHLDIFPEYKTRFGFREVCSGTTTTFVLFKKLQLRVFEQAVSLWLYKHSIVSHGQILDLLGRWDHTRLNTEKLLIHLLFAEAPPAFHMGHCRAGRVLALFDEVDMCDHATYETVCAMWNTFLRIWYTPFP